MGKVRQNLHVPVDFLNIFLLEIAMAECLRSSALDPEVEVGATFAVMFASLSKVLSLNCFSPPRSANRYLAGQC